MLCITFLRGCAGVLTFWFVVRQALLLRALWCYFGGDAVDCVVLGEAFFKWDFIWAGG